MWIFDNPLGNMHGPDFLVLYAFVIVVVWIMAFIRCRGVDTTDWHEPSPIPKSPNPYDIAVLRGGANELIRTLIAVLVDAGAVEIKQTKDKRGRTSDELQRTDVASSRLAPNSLESKVLGYFDFPRSPARVFSAGGLSDLLHAEVAVIEDRLYQEHMLATPPMRSSAAWKAMQGFLIIAGLGLYKFAAAIHHGRHNVAFLIVGGVIGGLVLLPISHLPRLTRRGRRHIERMRTAYGSLRVRRAEDDSAMGASTVALAASIFGIAAIDGLAGIEIRRAFSRAAAQGDASSCGAVFACGAATTGSSCGSGGSSCGGGGCGGGGCGGCGGG